MQELKIVKIEEIGMIDMCDIEVSGNNLFFANSILTHNSAVVATRDQTAIGQDHIQGGISKINTSDLVIALVKDEAMDAAGEYRFEFLKARNSNAVNKKLLMRWDSNSLQITDASALCMNKPKKSGLSSVVPGAQSGGLNDLLQ